MRKDYATEGKHRPIYVVYLNSQRSHLDTKASDAKVDAREPRVLTCPGYFVSDNGGVHTGDVYYVSTASDTPVIFQTAGYILLVSHEINSLHQEHLLTKQSRI